MEANYYITTCRRCGTSYEGDEESLEDRGTFHPCFDGQLHCEGGCCPVKGFHDCDGWDPDSGCIAMDIGGVVPVERPHTCTKGIKRCDRCCQCGERVQLLINKNPATPDSAYMWWERPNCHVCHHQADETQWYSEGAVIRCEQCDVAWTIQVRKIDRMDDLHIVHYRSVFTEHYQGYFLGVWGASYTKKMGIDELNSHLRRILDEDAAKDPDYNKDMGHTRISGIGRKP